MKQLKIKCDHKGGEEYHCQYCCPGKCEQHGTTFYLNAGGVVFRGRANFALLSETWKAGRPKVSGQPPEMTELVLTLKLQGGIYGKVARPGEKDRRFGVRRKR